MSDADDLTPLDPGPDSAVLVHDAEAEADALVEADADAAVDDPVVLDDEPVVLEDEPIVLDGADAVTAGPAVVDPRMQRRWIDQRRSEGRRRLRIVVGIVAFAVVALLAWVVAHSSLLGADTVEVRGTSRLDPAAVRTAAAVDDGAPLLFLDEEAIVRRVQALPAVASARVHTELPHTVVVEVTERQPVAWANASAPDDVALIDAAGTVFARQTDPPPGLLRLDGVTAGAVGSRVPHAGALARIGRLPVRLRLMTDHFGLTGKGAAVLVLRKGTAAADQVVLGDGTQTARKGAVALAILDDLAARGEHRGTVDVTVPDAPVVR